MQPNELAAMLALYDKNMPGRGGMPDQGGFSMSAGATAQRNNMDAYNDAGGRLQWAMRMAEAGGGHGTSAPNFFPQGGGYQPPAYIHPQMREPSMPPAMANSPPQQPDLQNYLASLLKNRGH